MFNDKQKNLLWEFYHSCFEYSVSVEQKTDTWSCSYWTYEVMENLILGKSRYKECNLTPWLYTKPKYRNSTSFLKYGDNKRKMFCELMRLASSFDNLVVCEVGYGVDIILASIVKDWKEIICYDMVKDFGAFINLFFVEKKGINIKFSVCNSNAFKFDEIKKSTLVISNNTHISIGEPSDRIKNNPRLVYLRDGVIMYQNDMPTSLGQCRKKFGRGYL